MQNEMMFSSLGKNIQELFNERFEEVNQAINDLSEDLVLNQLYNYKSQLYQRFRLNPQSVMTKEKSKVENIFFDSSEENGKPIGKYYGYKFTVPGSDSGSLEVFKYWPYKPGEHGGKNLIGEVVRGGFVFYINSNSMVENDESKKYVKEKAAQKKHIIVDMCEKYDERCKEFNKGLQEKIEEKLQQRKAQIKKKRDNLDDLGDI